MNQVKGRPYWPQQDKVNAFKRSVRPLKQLWLPGMGKRPLSEAEALRQADEMLERLFASDMEPDEP